VTGFLLDTNVISELRRAKPGRKVVVFIENQSLESLFVSLMTHSPRSYSASSGSPTWTNGRS